MRAMSDEAMPAWARGMEERLLAELAKWRRDLADLASETTLNLIDARVAAMQAGTIEPRLVDEAFSDLRSTHNLMKLIHAMQDQIARLQRDVRELQRRLDDS